MDPVGLIEGLKNLAAYPFPVDTVEVRHTHISVVFLAGRYVYKIKKPVQLGFLDFTTLERRRHFCDEEVRLNRRLAPTVYLGVVPVTATATGLEVEGSGDVVEWAVKMERLADDATLLERVRRREVEAPLLKTLACRLAHFHAAAERGAHISTFGRFDVVARNARENFEQSVAQQGITLSRAVFERLRVLTEATLERLRPLIEARAERGLPCDTHGDLHLDHVYIFPERAPPADLIVIDCIEFNERFRYSDPVADMAFLYMDLQFRGRSDLAGVFADAYFRAANDDEGRDLLALYTAYRAAVRGKVEGFKLAEKEIPESERSAALTRARAHWLLALGELEPSIRKPCLLLVGGLPGSGKSTLARGLAAQTGFCLIRSDAVRKELAATTTEGQADGIYTREWTERTYSECLRRAELLVFEGKRVLVDATFRQEKHRRTFFEAAVRWGVPALMLVCQAEPETIRRRLHERREDISDADWLIHVQAARSWEEAGSPALGERRVLSTEGTPEQAGARALAELRSVGLYGAG